MNPQWQQIARRLSPYSSLIGLAFVFLIFALHPVSQASFLTESNLKVILVQCVIVGLGAIGMTMIIVSGGIDLSVGSSIALSSVVAAAVLKSGAGPWAALMAAMITGLLIGLANGGLITGLRLTPFIVTLGMLGIARGLSKWVADNQTIYIPRTWINDIMQVFPAIPPDSPLGKLREAFPAAGFFYLAPGVYIMLGLGAVMVLVMARTVFGRHIHAVGSNESCARICGIRTERTKLGVYALAGAFFGLAGLMQMARLQQGDPTTAVGLELDIIAAVIIGGASLSGGSGSIIGSLVGALMMVVLRNGTFQMGLPNYFQEIMIGAVIVAAVTLDRIRNRNQGAT
ncbi:ABC transporter permease [Oscillatoria amoena NRMC-F 0135]|nr:ABC transporter permease [Oscillatoria amoena NRMC-F 0135]